MSEWWLRELIEAADRQPNVNMLPSTLIVSDVVIRPLFNEFNVSVMRNCNEGI